MSWDIWHRPFQAFITRYCYYYYRLFYWRMICYLLFVIYLHRQFVSIIVVVVTESSSCEWHCYIARMIHGYDMIRVDRHMSALLIFSYTIWTSSSAMAERRREAWYVFDQHPALFAKSCTQLIFGPPHGGIKGNICALAEIFNTKKPCSRVSSKECQFYS